MNKYEQIHTNTTPVYAHGNTYNYTDLFILQSHKEKHQKDSKPTAKSMPAQYQQYSEILFCSLAVLDPRVGHTMDVLSPFIPVHCHSD